MFNVFLEISFEREMTLQGSLMKVGSMFPC